MRSYQSESGTVPSVSKVQIEGRASHRTGINQFWWGAEANFITQAGPLGLYTLRSSWKNTICKGLVYILTEFTINMVIKPPLRLSDTAITLITLLGLYAYITIWKSQCAWQ